MTDNAENVPGSCSQPLAAEDSGKSTRVVGRETSAAVGVRYSDWLAKKRATQDPVGIPESQIDPLPAAFDYQAALIRWALRRGRAAVFADTGLGKTLIQLDWARHVSRVGRVLILSPLAVAQQTAREGARFGVECSAAQSDNGARVLILNYDNLHKIDPSQFAGVVLDESSILKAFTGATRTAIIEAFQKTPYRLACTATPAPNDYTELGNHAEFLGVKTRVEMLAEYFVHDMEGTQDWRLKGHAKAAFWRWVVSWGAVVRTPADLGFDASRFDLPELRMHEHVVGVNHRDSWVGGPLFATTASTLGEQRQSRRATMADRVSRAAELCGDRGPALVWCELNDEAEAVASAVRGAVNVKGSDDADTKAEAMLAFARGDVRVLVSKPSICGFGMNWQHCRRMVFLGASNSYEQTYQAIRRCWRFGQTKPVDVHIIRAETDDAIVRNYKRKAEAAAAMADELSAYTADAVREILGKTGRQTNAYDPTNKMEIPSWCQTSAF